MSGLCLPRTRQKALEALNFQIADRETLTRELGE